EKKLEITDKPVKVYNFKVDNFHTYHVGENRVLVHNANKYVKGTRSTLKSLGNKTEQYVTKRGWTWDSMDDVVKKPYTTREAINKATGNPATAYYNKAGDYVVVDNVTGELVQVSKFGDTGWIPDATIKNPYKP
ncbi:MAG: hypothetical protein GX494_13660, partial [Clostridiaceae bacterium]|nr:hypothetical protein [Clostridiaceae bacterium]